MGILHCGGALALASLSLGPIPTVPIYSTHPYVSRVQCDRGSGSAFRVAQDLYVSAAHVTNMSGCTIDGQTYLVRYSSNARDLSILEVARSRNKGIKVNCDGYKPGEWVYAIGYAHGYHVKQVIAVRGRGMDVDLIGRGEPFAVLDGARFIPGMSGGPVINLAGEVVGLVNAYNPLFLISFSQALKGSPLCQS